MVIENVATGFPYFQHSTNDKLITSGGCIAQSRSGNYLYDSTHSYEQYVWNIAVLVYINWMYFLFAINHNHKFE